ncbi:hypothetical protein [Candidatus Solincola tengchongensis]|nr:hypothetical protein [Candidatus Solincola tengchongensis]
MGRRTSRSRASGGGLGTEAEGEKVKLGVVSVPFRQYRGDICPPPVI